MWWYWFNAECPNEVVPLLSPCDTATAAMLPKIFGGKFKYLNQKNFKFLAGNLNAKCKIQMQMLTLMQIGSA